MLHFKTKTTASAGTATPPAEAPAGGMVTRPAEVPPSFGMYESPGDLVAFPPPPEPEPSGPPGALVAIKSGPGSRLRNK